MMLGK